MFDWVMICFIFALPVIVLCGFIARRARFFCQRCNGKVRALRDLTAAEREGILAYYRSVEGRIPEIGRIHVCPLCHSVYDDFSGERFSREPILQNFAAFCKACGKLMHREDAQADAIACNHCGVLHRWTRHEPSGHVFLARADGQPVTITCIDYSLGGA